MTLSASSSGEIIATPIATLNGNVSPSWVKSQSAIYVDQPSGRVVGDRFGGIDQEDRELVAADPRHAVAPAHAADQHARDLDQRFVAGLVAEAVVDQLQSIEIDEQHRRIFIVAAHAADRLVEAAHEAAAVRKLDQRILVGELVELLDHLLQPRNFPAQPHNFVEQVVIAGNVGEMIVHKPEFSDSPAAT